MLPLLAWPMPPRETLRPMEAPNFSGASGLLWVPFRLCLWSRRQESNLYFTLRRHAHYPLCYGG